ncbi:MAG: GxxExxY protein [Bacteroidales bacterium]|nr:GxxExxY protein [Bacteroidales bacterium]
METEQLVTKIIECAWIIRHTFEPGYEEQVYEEALMIELADHGISAQSQVKLPVFYKGHKVGNYRADIIVDGRVIIEMKACDATITAHKVQLVNYLKITGIDEGIILNYGENSFCPIRKSRIFDRSRFKNPQN